VTFGSIVISIEPDVFMRRRHFLAALPLLAAGLIKPSVGTTAPVFRVGAVDFETDAQGT